VSEREKRTATNEALFREVNERLEDRVQVAVGDHAPFAALCECADPECTERIMLTPAEYEEAHADPTQFVVLDGHVAEDVEDVVFRNDRFVVVRKRGLAGEIAEALD
jgi:hypothetical protein